MQVKPRAANFEDPLKFTHAFREFMVRPAAATYRVGWSFRLAKGTQRIAVRCPRVARPMQGASLKTTEGCMKKIAIAALGLALLSLSMATTSWAQGGGAGGGAGGASGGAAAGTGSAGGGVGNSPGANANKTGTGGATTGNKGHTGIGNH